MSNTSPVSPFFVAPRRSTGDKVGDILETAGKVAFRTALASTGLGGLAGAVGVGGSDTAEMEQMMKEGYKRQLQLIELQQQSQQQTLTVTTISNIYKNDHEARMSAVRNIGK